MGRDKLRIVEYSALELQVPSVDNAPRTVTLLPERGLLPPHLPHSEHGQPASPPVGCARPVTPLPQLFRDDPGTRMSGAAGTRFLAPFPDSATDPHAHPNQPSPRATIRTPDTRRPGASA